MFLKQITLQGFKSFANKTVINFESDYTGIVGPNGCGKSNIIDAVKWVLGEQSAKSMRGSQMSDVVFAGSADKKAVNMAEVTLLFDNSNHVLNSEFNEIEVTRRMYRNTNESVYLINKEEVRLKDVVELTLDSGIGKDSLSIISQGNIQQFAEAKPLERRVIFEEAASVSKYKKRKIESLSKLARTQDNIDRLNDILSELEKQVSPLKRQAAKAKRYLEKKERLTEIEVAVIVNDVNNYNADLQTFEKELFDLNYQQTSINANITMLDESCNNLKDEMNTLDNDVQVLQDKLLKNLNDIQNLEKRKVEVDEKRKYILETGATQSKIEETRNLLNDAKIELEDRVQRKDNTEASLALLSENVESYIDKITKLNEEINKDNNTLVHLNNRRSLLESLIKAPFENQSGVKAIVANKKALNGIMDVVSDCFIADEGYEQMVSTALASSIFHIITSDEASARNAIRFLKKNKVGSATFLPLNVLKPRYVQNDHLFICENTEGFLGLASDFVDCKEEYDVVVLALLGNVLVADNLENANAIARRLNYQYKVVTLDGDVIYKGGTLAGGYNKQNDSPLTYQSQLDDIKERIASIENKISNNTSELSHYSKLLKDDQQEIMNLKLSLASLNEIIDIKSNKYEQLKADYDRFSPNEKETNESYEDKLIVDLNTAYALKDEITNAISSKRARRVEANNEYQRKYNQLRQIRNDYHIITNQINEINIEKAKMIANKENLLERLTRDYALTFEFASAQEHNVDLETAKQEVVTLRYEIEELGNINLDAPSAYEEVNERYEFMSKQLDDLTQAKEKLLSVINEMDQVMTERFNEMFDKINIALADVFTSLFGGGRARLFLENPDDVLNSGIDIDVQPPGKNIQNIRLFSGGEKSLIAICVLFAILKVRTVPLVVFDEVEASLDENNVDKFASYIHKFANNSQFLVITHRPGTMSQCDVLYGVTMQQKGISNLLKVKLKEALEYASKEQDGSIQ